MGSLLTKSYASDWISKADSNDGVLPRSFYERDTLKVSRELLGKVLVVRTDPHRSLLDPKAGVTVARIVETEAYHGDDPASHCARGETPRCSVMFGPGGVAYVYFIYGMYEMLNFVTEKKGYPGAALIRAVEPLQGHDLMRARRVSRAGVHIPEKQWTNGPGRLCRAMGIQMSDNEAPLEGPRLYVVDDGFKPKKVEVSKRIGISVGLDKPWRFFIAGNPYVSKAPKT